MFPVRPHIPPSVEKAEMIPRREIIDRVAEFAEGHVEEQQNAAYII
jgi:hypothetical protein